MPAGAQHHGVGGKRERADHCDLDTDTPPLRSQWLARWEGCLWVDPRIAFEPAAAAQHCRVRSPMQVLQHYASSAEYADMQRALLRCAESERPPESEQPPVHRPLVRRKHEPRRGGCSAPSAPPVPRPPPVPSPPPPEAVRAAVAGMDEVALRFFVLKLMWLMEHIDVFHRLRHRTPEEVREHIELALRAEAASAAEEDGGTAVARGRDKAVSDEEELPSKDGGEDEEELPSEDGGEDEEEESGEDGGEGCEVWGALIDDDAGSGPHMGRTLLHQAYAQACRSVAVQQIHLVTTWLDEISRQRSVCRRRYGAERR